MARIRKGICYRKLERPYTRISRYKRQSFIKTGYNSKIIRFVMGDLQKADWDLKLELCTKSSLQLRDNSVESARLTSNKLLETVLGKEGYFFRVKKYPYHILRMNPIASGAGADRFSTGMQLAFGRPVGQAAQFKKGDTIFELLVDKKNLETAKKAMERAYHKIACPCQIVVTDLKKAK
ncbi:MAG: 50S ribosomal protein L16 [Nanoarchaeota archaeon]|nr:50S ribosomal protein L16 [Nanoarchaeota archaeon]